MTEQAAIQEVAANLRGTLIGLLRTFASPEEQRSYQAAVPFVNVPTELFVGWADDVYHPDTEAFRLAFDFAERAVLKEFDTLFQQAAALPDMMPDLDQFQATPQAAELARTAAGTLARLVRTPEAEGRSGPSSLDQTPNGPAVEE